MRRTFLSSDQRKRPAVRSRQPGVTSSQDLRPHARRGGTSVACRPSRAVGSLDSSIRPAVSPSVVSVKDPWTRDEQLAPESECVCAAADSVGDAPTRTMRARIDRAYDFLAHRFLPNARAEERMRRRLAARDHRCIVAEHEVEEIDELTHRLSALKATLADRGGAETLRDLRRTLYEIAGLLRLHYMERGPAAQTV